MSVQAVETILSRAMSDAEFGASLFENPDQALAGYDLTADETKSMKSMPRAEFDLLAAASPEVRKSMALTLNHNESWLTVR